MLDGYLDYSFGRREKGQGRRKGGRKKGRKGKEVKKRRKRDIVVVLV